MVLYLNTLSNKELYRIPISNSDGHPIKENELFVVDEILYRIVDRIKLIDKQQGGIIQIHVYCKEISDYSSYIHNLNNNTHDI